MQHIRKCDAPEYLPFARNCIKRLQATGLEYASQKFDAAGVTIRVEIRPGAEYIWIEGGSFDLNMDTGLVDIKSYDPENAAVFYPGTLYEAQNNYLYNLLFVPTDPVSNWRKNPNHESAGQIAGLITYKRNRFAGQVPYDAQDARCFSPGKESLDGETVTAKAEDDLLKLKKIVATFCPASIFTGRCRLWFQSIYGNPTYSKDSPEGIPARIPLLGPNFGNNIAPSVMMPTYAPPGEAPSTDPIEVTTSCGVVFEASTGTHWLIVPSMHVSIESNVVAYPLIGSAKAERMRQFLRSSSSVLTQAVDRENLEAHILASCLPDARNAKIIGTMTTPDGWYMGYGWHWNWSGSQAAIVANGQFIQSVSESGTATGMRSKRYTLDITATPAGGDSKDVSFTIAKTLNEEVDWAVDRTFWVICEPNWATRMPAKTTPKLSTPLEADAPFYVFYVRDEMKVCRIKSELVALPTATRTVTPGFGVETPYGAISESTFGMDSGSCRDITHGDPRWTATISCGGWSKGNLQKSWGEGGSSASVHSKANTGVYGAGYGATTAINVDMEYGTSVPYATVHVNYGSTNTGQLACITFTDEHTTLNRSGWATVEVVVPMNDAEAIYIRNETYEQEDATGQMRLRQTYPAASASSIAGSGWVEQRTVVEVDIATSFVLSTTNYLKYDAVAPPAALPGWNIVSTDNAWVVPTVVTGASESFLFSHAGQTTVDFGSLDQFHNNTFEDIVADFTTFSGTRTENPVVIATARSGTVGTHGAPTTAAVIVGQL